MQEKTCNEIKGLAQNNIRWWFFVDAIYSLFYTEEWGDCPNVEFLIFKSMPENNITKMNVEIENIPSCYITK